MKIKHPDDKIQFLAGGGKMGELTRAKDWNKTSLGNPEFWPQSLRTTLSILLKSKFPMFLWWGPELICFYNDAYRPSLGQNGKHPSILGMKAEEAWAETWHVIKPLIDQVLAGGDATWSEDQLIPIYRNGKMEDVYWTFSYSPVQDESGKVAGVLVTCNETTDKVNTFKSLQESEKRFRTMADNIPHLAWMANADGWIYWYNNKWYEYTGTSPAQMEGWGWQSVHDPEELPRVLDKWKGSIVSGQPFEMVFPLKGSDGKFRQFLTRVLPVKNSDGKIDQWFGSNTDISEQKNAEQALKESEERFRTMAENSEVLIAVGDETSNVTYLNKAWVDLTGRAMEDLINFGWTDLLHPDDRQAYIDIYLSAFEKRAPFTGEFRIIDKEGGFRWLFTKAPPRFRPDGSFAGYISSAVDITELKKTEEDLKAQQRVLEESESKLNLIINASELGTWEINVKTKEIIYSDRFLEITGHKYRVKLTLDDTVKLIHPNDLIIREEAFKKAFKTGVLHFTGRIVWSDHSIHWIESKGKVFYDEQDNPFTIIGTIADITDERRQQQILFESEQKFRLLADSMPQHIWTSDTEGNLNYYNQSVYDYSGLTRQQIDKDGWMQIVHPDDREENIKQWINSITTGKDFLFEHRFRKYTGEYRWQLSRALPQKDENGKIQMWVGTSTDIQEQKTFANELERQVRERTKELEQKNIDLEKMNKELKSFAYISSHDLQEPLRKIQTFATRIVEKEYQNLSDNGKEYFKRMQNAAIRMQTLIDDLLAYSRTNTAERKYEKTDLNKIVEEVKADLKEELQQKQATLEATEICEVNIIPFQFRQLLHNLVSNSLKFSKPDQAPHIKIKSEIVNGTKFKNDKLSDKTTYCHISISDNGIGFEQQYSEKIFELFQRLHGKSQYNGTGIGLAIVKKIVENHNGVITAKAEINKGATFDIYIPTT